ncbi:hypothetical protein ACFLQ2_03340 [archaeon]
MPNVLIPVITGLEWKKSFLLEAAGQADLTVVVYLIDQSSGLTAGEMQANLDDKETMLKEIDEMLHSFGKRSKIYNEWGSIKEKIPMIAKREKVKEIVVLKRGKMAEKEIAEIKSLGIPVREIEAY